MPSQIDIPNLLFALKDMAVHKVQTPASSDPQHTEINRRCYAFSLGTNQQCSDFSDRRLLHSASRRLAVQSGVVIVVEDDGVFGVAVVLEFSICHVLQHRSLEQAALHPSQVAGSMQVACQVRPAVIRTMHLQVYRILCLCRRTSNP